MQHTSADGSGTGLALRDYGLAELATAMEALGMRGSRLHAGVHQARKSIRRTRALLALGGAALGPGGELVDRQLRRVGRSLSLLRDAHALVQTLDRLAVKARDEATRDALHSARRIAARRRAALSREPEVQQALREATDLLATLRAALIGLPWEGLAAASVTEAIATSTQRADAARGRAFRRDEPEDWHRWRRRMRRISQQHRAASTADLVPALSQFDKHLTEQLGVLQDLSLLVAHCRRDSPFPKPARQALRAFAARRFTKQCLRIRSVAPRGPGA